MSLDPTDFEPDEPAASEELVAALACFRAEWPGYLLLHTRQGDDRAMLHGADASTVAPLFGVEPLMIDGELRLLGGPVANLIQRLRELGFALAVFRDVAPEQYRITEVLEPLSPTSTHNPKRNHA